MGREKMKAKIINPCRFKKCWGGILNSKRNKKANQTERTIKNISKVIKNKNLVLAVLLKILEKNFTFLRFIKFLKAIYYVFYLFIG